jgi:hypothetical protein
MKKLGFLFVLALSFILGIGRQNLHASDCVDETDREGGDCRTSKCAVPCDGSGSFGVLQSKRQSSPLFAMPTRNQRSSSKKLDDPPIGLLYDIPSAPDKVMGAGRPLATTISVAALQPIFPKEVPSNANLGRAV